MDELTCLQIPRLGQFFDVPRSRLTVGIRTRGFNTMYSEGFGGSLTRRAVHGAPSPFFLRRTRKDGIRAHQLAALFATVTFQSTPTL